MVKFSEMFRENVVAIGLFSIIFLPNFDLYDDPTENGPDEKPSRNIQKPVSKLYAMFIKSVVPIFRCFNTFLQPKEPLIHIFHHSALRLYYLLFSVFILT